MSSEISYEEAKSFSGYLDKKSNSLIAIWQKRYFQILEGKIMIYSEKKGDSEIKGQINLEQISMPESVDNKVFKFNLDSKVFILRAKNEEEKAKWINIITLLKKKLIEMRAEREKDKEKEIGNENQDNLNDRKESISQQNPTKKHKVANAGKVTAELIKKYGFVTNKEEILSKELLKIKGISQLINIDDPKITNRIYHGFIFKKHKVRDYFQKRWFFIFSSRPLLDSHYMEDDVDLEQKKLKDWLKFDTLFYFKVDGEDDDSKSLGSLELLNSHKIELLDKDDKFYLYLDVEDRRFEFYCESKAERDIWFEVLKNARRTAKEYYASITKHPRNVELLNNIFLLGEKELIKKLEKEKNAIAGNYNENEDFYVLEFTLNNLGNSIESTLDGCNSNDPPKKDLLKAYVVYMNKEYLEIIRSYWDKKFFETNIYEILKMSMLLFNFGDKLYILNVDDPNFKKNGKELIKIYLKKTYYNVLMVIENILKDEREIKALTNEQGVYYTKGPNDLFELLNATFDLCKANRNKYLYQLILNLFYSSVNQYLLGVEAVVTNLDIIIDKEYLLAMSNNSLYIINLINKVIDDFKDMNVLNEKEINENLKLEKLMEIINKISLKSVTTFVFYFFDDLGKYFKDASFISLNMTKILIETNDIFGSYKQYMNNLVQKKVWNEILKLTLYHYIHLLLTSDFSQVTVEQIREKLKTDIGILKETYEGLVGKNLTTSTIKILNDIHDFLDVSSYMISSSCLTLREYVGPSFNLNVVKALLKLRSDFKEEDMNDAIEQCKEVLDNFQDNNSKEDSNTTNYFEIIEKEMKRKEDEEKKLKKRNTLHGEYIPIIGSGEKVEEEDKYIEEENKEGPITTFALDDFLNKEEEDKDEISENDIVKYQEEDKEVGQEEVSDITYEGFMQKKSHSTWQTRYFQVKSGYLYWFKEKNSSTIQNKISIKQTLRVDSHKDKKFMMVVRLNANDAKESKENEEDEEKSKEYDGKIYKFSCQTNEERDAWVNAITKEMIKIKKGEEKTKRYKLEIPMRKKIIKDYFNLSGLNDDLYYMRRTVLEEMSMEDYFKPSKRKIEALKRKKIREENERAKKQKEIEEKKIKEENKKIEEDIKNGKDVGITDRLKFWFRSSVEGF